MTTILPLTIYFLPPKSTPITSTNAAKLEELLLIFYK